jgi:hypothetical protein
MPKAAGMWGEVEALALRALFQLPDVPLAAAHQFAKLAL